MDTLGKQRRVPPSAVRRNKAFSRGVTCLQGPRKCLQHLILHQKLLCAWLWLWWVWHAWHRSNYNDWRDNARQSKKWCCLLAQNTAVAASNTPVASEAEDKGSGVSCHPPSPALHVSVRCDGLIFFGSQHHGQCGFTMGRRP